MARKHAETGNGQGPVGMALQATAGAALVLDDELRVVLATPGVEPLLGFPVPLGAHAVKLLCGQGQKRPVAEAMAEGRAVQALIPRPNAEDPEQLVRVRAVPLGSVRDRAWLLMLEHAGHADAEGPVLFHGMWTQDPGMKRVLRLVERVAGEDVTVLVRGETGTGKELVARAIHDLSARKNGPFRALNCAALPASLLESELFGHARGAFTGAVKDTPGHLQMAHRGTLFLDEVAELPLELQAKLLRVLETRTVLPVGGRDAIPVDVRIVSATHRALRKEVEAGRFRADLMYRLRVIPIFLPALRERPVDVALLSERFVEELNGRGRRRIEQISPAAMRILESYPWPGNIRELRNALTYAFTMGDGPVLLPGDLPPELEGVEPQMPVATAPATPAPDDETRRLLAALERAGGNRQRAARILGISRVTLWRRMRAAGLEAEAEASNGSR
ncbi:MAG: sigma 54-interacting transcriptional regulator [Myxococcota bacterium]